MNPDRIQSYSHVGRIPVRTRARASSLVRVAAIALLACVVSIVLPCGLVLATPEAEGAPEQAAVLVASTSPSGAAQSAPSGSAPSTPSTVPKKGSAAAKQRVFPSAEAAAQGLVGAIKAEDMTALIEIFGPGSESLVVSGDPVQDRATYEAFTMLWDEKHTIEVKEKERTIIVLGHKEWPFPIPVVKTAAGWVFDTKAGREEILNRRIGRNELATIQTCLAIVDAQDEYFRKDHDGDSLLSYASKFHSTPGKHDGLSWPTVAGEPSSPLGELIASATAEGYKKDESGEMVPYHGYYFKLLTSQGKNAPGGAYGYMVKGKMFGGFGLVAWPAIYDSSGIMTFITNQDGVLYQKDLGPDTASKAGKMSSFDPDTSWTKVTSTAADADPEPDSDSH